MRRMYMLLATALAGAGLAAAVPACSSDNDNGNGGENTGETGSVSVALSNAPSDVSCLKISVAGPRPQTRLIDITPGSPALYTLNRLPLGIVTISGEAYLQVCNAIQASTIPSYVSEAPVSVRVDAVDVNQVTLRLIRNARVQVGIDFESGPEPYLVPVAPGVATKALFTVGDSVNDKPDGTPYRMVGIPDGLGAFDNGDGTFTLLMNHELSSGGSERAHGASGAFVSKWKIRTSDLTVLRGDDLVQRVVKWDTTTSAYLPPASGIAFSRFCSADLAPISAWYDAATSTGFNDRLFMNGEETGNEGKGYAHAMDGVSYELPRLGKLSWENSIAHPNLGAQTAVVGMDDSTPGQVYVYVGTKNNTGSTPVAKAGLTNGTLYGVKVADIALEPSATGIPSGTAFTLHSLGNVENTTGEAIETASNAAGITRFLRPEDGAWDPSNPSDFYFVTTASFTTASRLWRLHFNDLKNLAAGGTIHMLLDGTEGGKMFDNMTVDKKGHVYLQEDVGNNAHIGKVWRYTIGTDQLTLVAQHNLGLFTSGAAGFLTQDEESSGIIDASDIIGPGWFLLDVQAHYRQAGELVEGGQMIALFDPAAK